MPRPLISIIVPIYNAERYLRRCIDSILAQTYEEIEVILVDDGSSDSCLTICDEYAERDRRVLVIHQENSGVCAARNAGIEASKGDYFAFVDDDDWLEPDLYEVLYHLIKGSDADIAASYDCIGETVPKKTDISQCIVFSKKEAVRRLLDNQCELTAVWGKLYRKEILEDIRFSPSLYPGEDALFEVQAILKSRKIAYLNYQGYHYRVHADSASHALSQKAVTILDSIDEIIHTLGGFDQGLASYAENHVLMFDLYLAKRLADQERLTRPAYQKIITHIRKNKTDSAWALLSFKKKCWIGLLLLGRGPFILGRKVNHLLNSKEKLPDKSV